MEYDEMQNFIERRGIFFPSAEIHKPLAGFWDFGPYGANIRRKIIELWRKEIVRRTDGMEIEGCVIMPKQTFIASGHLKSFVDPIVQCTKCHKIYRADKLIEDVLKMHIPEALPEKRFDEIIKENNIRCPSCKGTLANVKKFNMMIGVSIGPLQKETNAYLRPETCQSIFTSFMKIYKTNRKPLPLAIAQVGRSFRNEISPRQMLVRLREITQLELEVFFNPKNARVKWYRDVKDYKLRLQLKGKEVEEISVDKAINDGIVSNELVACYLAIVQQFFEKCGFSVEDMRFRELDKDERAFYALETWDFELKTNVGWLELVACNYRGDYDLSSHSKVSGQDLSIIENNEKFIPHVFEVSMGLDRIFYCVIERAACTRNGKPVLKLPPYLAPLDAVILPLVRKDGIDELAFRVYENLKKHFDVKYDEKDSIGKRYLLYDEIGVPFAITIDYDSLKNMDVTIRDRDTTKQRRVKISKLREELEKAIHQ